MKVFGCALFDADEDEDKDEGEAAWEKGDLCLIDEITERGGG